MNALTAPADALCALQRLALAATLAVPAALAATPGQAMVLTNCLESGVGFVITGQTTGQKREFRLEPGRTREVPTGRAESFRLNINVPGKDVQYSNRKGTETIYLTTIAGNYELTSDGCRRPATQPRPQPETGGGLQDAAAKLLLHVAHCQSTYSSYRLSDNTYRSNGRRVQCVSPFL